MRAVTNKTKRTREKNLSRVKEREARERTEEEDGGGGRNVERIGDVDLSVESSRCKRRRVVKNGINVIDETLDNEAKNKERDENTELGEEEQTEEKKD